MARRLPNKNCLNVVGVVLIVLLLLWKDYVSYYSRHAQVDLCVQIWSWPFVLYHLFDILILFDIWYFCYVWYLTFFSCRPAARLHPAGLVRRPGRGDGDLFWGRLSCLLSGTLTNWPSWPSWLSWPWLFWPILGEANLLAARFFALALITWLRQSWPASLFWHFDGEATLLDYTRIS